MKIKFKKNLILPLALFAVIGFFGLVNKVSAACSYRIDFSERDGKTSATPSDYLSFSTKVVREGPKEDCSDQVIIRLEMVTKNGEKLISLLTKDFVVVPGYGSIATANQGLDVSSIDRGILPEINVLEFYTHILGRYSAQGKALNNIAENVPHIKIPITGAVGSSGNMGANIYFKDGQTGVQKSSFSSSDQVQILVQANSSDISKLGSNIGNIYAAVYINDFSKEVLNFNADKSVWAKQTLFKTLTVSKENGFIDGANTIRVKFFQANTSISLGYSDSTLQVQNSQYMPELIADNYSPKLGDTIKVSVKNAPEGWSGSLNINGQKVVPMSSSPHSLKVTTENGFENNKKNQVILTLEVGGKVKSVKNNGAISINVGSVADNSGDPGTNPGAGDTGGMQGQNDKTLYNPISGVDSLTDLLLKIMQGFLVIIGVWSVVFIVLGGFRLVMSQGNEEAVGAAKKTITWAVIGLVVALLAFSIVAIVQNLLGIDIKE